MGKRMMAGQGLAVRGVAGTRPANSGCGLNWPETSIKRPRGEGQRLSVGTLLACALFVAASTAAAQTLDEAVRGNATLALSLCLSSVPDQSTLNAAFTAAGFAHAPEDFGGGEVAHWFVAPADTVSVMVQGHGREGYCAISTQHMGVTAAVPFAGEALNSLYPSTFAYGEIENTPPVTPGSPGAQDGDCTGYTAWVMQRPVIVSIANAGNGPTCTEDGTSQIMVSMTHPLGAPGGAGQPAPAPEPALTSAPTFDEAVRANLAVALQLCLMDTGSAPATVSAFVGAGFAYSTRGTPGVDVWHQFAAPAATVTAELYEGQMAPDCAVMSDHIGTAAAIPVVGTLLNQLYPGRFAFDQSEGPGCASFTDYAPAIPFVVSVRGRGEDRPCADIGTIHITSFSAV